MKFIDEFRNKELAQTLVKKIHEISPKQQLKFMEVCGTHTVAIFKFGIKNLLPKNISLISGPGCPVCVTPTSDIDLAIEMSKRKDVIITTFGDMIRVPGSHSSLEKEKMDKANVEIVYSPLDSLDIAKKHPEKSIVFISVGFETTSPTIAATILQAEKENIKNFYILPFNKVIPPPMGALLDSNVKIDGFICPGHVSVIIGSKPYEFIPRQYNIPCVITGFEPIDILQSIYMLLLQKIANKAKVEIQYKRTVTPEGNKTAVDILYKVFKPSDSNWRGLGVIKNSGLTLAQKYIRFDAGKKFNIHIKKSNEFKGCKCADVLKGIIVPTGCRLFGKKCSPETPLGACMVSSEGTCAAYYKYNLKK